MKKLLLMLLLAGCAHKPGATLVNDMSQPMTREMHLRNHVGNPACTSTQCEWHGTWKELSDCWVCRIGMPLGTSRPNTRLTIVGME